MAGLKEIRTRIASVRSTRQITAAMKLVAAARLRKTQDRIVQLRPYADKLDEILGNLYEALEGEVQNPLMENREPEKILIVLVTSNRGLWGAFNSNASKHALALIRDTYAEQYRAGHVSVLALGRKGADLLKARGIPVSETNQAIFDELNFSNTSAIAEDLMTRFINKEFDRIDFVYNQFKNAAVQNVVTETFLPLVFEGGKISKHNFDFIFEPDTEFLVRNLIPRTLKIKVFKMLLDSYTAEHGARMTAMHQATDNATELIRELTLKYNKARQAAITREIMDIVGGAEALR